MATPLNIRKNGFKPIYFENTYVPAPRSAVVAYISAFECNILGFRWHSKSRTTPPNVAVNIPHMMQINGFKPFLIPFCAPMTQKAPTPIVSVHHNKLPSSSTIFCFSNSFHVKNVMLVVARHKMIYSTSEAQNTGAFPISKSLTVPPPIDVIVPTIVQPSRSIDA